MRHLIKALDRRTSQSRNKRNSGTPREFLRFREGVDSYWVRAGPGSIRNYRTKRGFTSRGSGSVLHLYNKKKASYYYVLPIVKKRESNRNRLSFNYVCTFEYVPAQPTLVIAENFLQHTHIIYASREQGHITFRHCFPARAYYCKEA
jgi:hypothetical protein